MMKTINILPTCALLLALLVAQPPASAALDDPAFGGGGGGWGLDSWKKPDFCGCAPQPHRRHTPVTPH